MTSEKIKKALTRSDWPLESFNGMTLALSPLLKSVDFLSHAFTTRLGGKSRTPLDSFNLGRHWPCDESKADAMQNRRQLCEIFAIDADSLAVPAQQHTNNVHLIDRELSGGPFQFPAIDALATAVKEQPLLLHFADCVPVILVDRVKKNICVIHAGWRGTAGGIVKNSLELMLEKMGSKPQHIAAAIGPAIGSCCFQTGGEVPQQLEKTVQNSDGLVEYKNDSAYPDLKAFNAMQLLDSGVEDIDVSNWCTACHPEIFYSHRQSGGQTGRQGALACIR
ncbi:MAG: peptidoglycan editing factor PgeF [Candidatus Obscuribacterales bacterium]|nr:peptidoglycan editing factor PgeF [Candidatus Obscuribacterales bacterium]